MAAITINDLPINRDLDRQAMSAIRGAGGAPWVFGAFRPYVEASPSVAPVVNFFQVNNSFFANQMINQSQTVNINNSGANSNINAVLLGSVMP